MKARGWVVAAAVFAITATGWGAQAQDAPPQEVETMSVPAAAPPSGGPQWRVFSRSALSSSLIDGGNLETVGDEVHVKVARVSLSAPPGDYSHAVSLFGVRCDARQTHLISSTEAYEDGEPTETFAADEPWFEVRPDSFDEGVLEIGCGQARATGTPFDSIKAYIDAGRP